MSYCFDEFVGDMIVDPDAANAQTEHTQRVLVIVGQRAVADCAKKRRGKKRRANYIKISLLHALEK